MPIYFKTSGIRETAVTDTLREYPVSTQNALTTQTISYARTQDLVPAMRKSKCPPSAQRMVAIVTG